MTLKQIYNMKNLATAYELIKSKPGNMTPGVSPETLDATSLRTLQTIQVKLKNGKYKFPPARRIQIPKPGKQATRPLNIASPRDKITQKALHLVIEPLWEETFLDCSHGFRPRKGAKTAIQYVDSNFQSCHYIIEADFSKAFDSIQHERFMSIIQEKITCPKTLSLIRSGLKAGYVELGQIHENLSVGTPQGSILSPLLCNIYLHKLDLYMETIKSEFNVGVKRGKNAPYERLSNAVKFMRKKGRHKTQKAEYKTRMKELTSTPSMRQDDSYVKIQYVRYADDFIIGVEGSYKVAQDILKKVELWIKKELKLQLNPEKTGIVKYSERPIKFLGYDLMAPHLKGAVKPLERIKVAGRTITRKKKIRIRIRMDSYKVLQKLKANGFIRMRTSHAKHDKQIYRGTFRGNLINLDHADIIRYYSSVKRGLYNYYNFVGNMSQLAHVCWLLTESCCLTLARKTKLRTMAKTFRKFGSDLGCDVSQKGGQKKTIRIFNPTDFKRQKITSSPNPDTEPLKGLERVWNAKYTKSNLFKSCVICGETKNVAMHHVRKVRDMKTPKAKVDFFTRQMALINRKQVPLCKDHHTRLHSGNWTETEKDVLNRNK